MSSSADVPRLHFHRYEFKYLLGSIQLPGILRELELRMERDVHSNKDGSYFVRSHYFDTDSFDLYFEKLAGLRKRYKFRIRNYSSSIRYSSPLFLELKGRNNTLVYKHRMLLDSDATEKLMSAGTRMLADHILNKTNISNTGKRFVFDVYRKRISPSVVVDYQRTAFENRANPDFRVTLDRDVIAWRSGSNGHPSGGRHTISDGYGILEIKFRYRMPAWFLRLIQEFQLKQISFSKFARGTDAVYMNGIPSNLDRILERRPACLS